MASTFTIKQEGYDDPYTYRLGMVGNGVRLCIAAKRKVEVNYSEKKMKIYGLPFHMIIMENILLVVEHQIIQDV